MGGVDRAAGGSTYHAQAAAATPGAPQSGAAPPPAPQAGAAPPPAQAVPPGPSPAPARPTGASAQAHGASRPARIVGAALSLDDANKMGAGELAKHLQDHDLQLRKSEMTLLKLAGELGGDGRFAAVPDPYEFSRSDPRRWAADALFFRKFEEARDLVASRSDVTNDARVTELKDRLARIDKGQQIYEANFELSSQVDPGAYYLSQITTQAYGCLQDLLSKSHEVSTAFLQAKQQAASSKPAAGTPAQAAGYQGRAQTITPESATAIAGAIAELLEKHKISQPFDDTKHLGLGEGTGYIETSWKALIQRQAAEATNPTGPFREDLYKQSLDLCTLHRARIAERYDQVHQATDDGKPSPMDVESENRSAPAAARKSESAGAAPAAREPGTPQRRSKSAAPSGTPGSNRSPFAQWRNFPFRRDANPDTP